MMVIYRQKIKSQNLWFTRSSKNSPLLREFFFDASKKGINLENTRFQNELTFLNMLRHFRKERITQERSNDKNLTII